jgi:hypothetical protein
MRLHATLRSLLGDAGKLAPNWLEDLGREGR